jgi:ABC-type hemin transport system ATPase subunit
MGAGFSYLYHRVFGGGEYKVVMVGLDNAGKSTILYRLCGTASPEHTALRHRPRPRNSSRAQAPG